MIALDGKLQTSTLYKLLKSSQGEPDATAKFIWSSSTPPRVQFFGWLLVHDRVQSKTNLHRRKIVDAVVCDLCGDCPETATHLIFECLWPAASGEQSGFKFQLDFVLALYINYRNQHMFPANTLKH